MYLCGPGKHSCQPFCGPEGRFYCSDSVCFLWPAPFSYLCVSVMILGVCWKLSAAEQVKTDCCHTPAVVSILLTPLPVSCPLTTPHHYTCITLPMLYWKQMSRPFPAFFSLVRQSSHSSEAVYVSPPPFFFWPFAPFFSLMRLSESFPQKTA